MSYKEYLKAGMGILSTRLSLRIYKTASKNEYPIFERGRDIRVKFFWDKTPIYEFITDTTFFYQRNTNKEDRIHMRGWADLKFRMLEDAIERGKEASKRTRKMDNVSKLQYETENTTYDIRSVDPKRIIGASRLVVFNTRYKKLMIFESSPLVDGLSVKGTTIVGFDKKKSKERTVRKPQEILKDCSTGGIRVINNRYNSLTTKETIPTGRMNKNCVILQVLK
jgi:hypothetical protein|tara:strand:- start:109 stop:777 length:669 start_codon:yes stop_codon:yes gene_type:complete